MNGLSLTRSSPSGFPTLVRQRGVVLIIALIMLLILTLVGVAGLRDTQLQERMAGGAQDREIALQAAEAGLRDAESYIIAGTLSSIDSGGSVKNYNGSDDPADLSRADSGGNAVTEVEYWRDHYDWSGNNSNIYSGAALDDGISVLPFYVIEELPASYSAVPGSTNAGVTAATGIPTIRDFLITVRATGSTADSVVILQSQYRDVSVTP